jgi:hypothetical protein
MKRLSILTGAPPGLKGYEVAKTRKTSHIAIRSELKLKPRVR